jgi:hypothetical protein
LNQYSSHLLLYLLFRFVLTWGSSIPLPRLLMPSAPCLQHGQDILPHFFFHHVRDITPGIPKYPFVMTNIYIIQVIYMCRILKSNYIARLGRIIPSWAGTQQLRPAYKVVGWHITSLAKAGLGQLRPARPGHLSPAWAGALLPRLGRLTFFPGGPALLHPGWAGFPAVWLGRSSSTPAGLGIFYPAGLPSLHPGWASCSSAPAWAARRTLPRLGRFTPGWAG